MPDFIMYDDGTGLDAAVGGAVNLASRYEEDTGTSANAKVLKAEDIGLTRKTIPAYFDGMPIEWLNTTANTAAVTMNVMSLGSIDLRDKNGNALTGGELLANTRCKAFYFAVSGHARFYQTVASNNPPSPIATPYAVNIGGTGRASHTAYAPICGGTTGTGAQQSVASLGTSGHVLTSNGASALPTFQAPGGGGGKLVQTVYKEYGTFASYASTEDLQDDNSIPQFTEGRYIYQLDTTITPQNASNKLLVIVNFAVAQSTNEQTLSLFRDSGVNAIAAMAGYGNYYYPLVKRVVAGSTSATTFKVRIASLSTIYLNGSVSGQPLYGGVSASTMTIMEYE
jgi:hypothetical protein